MEEIDRPVGQVIKELRVEKGMDQIELARKVGLSNSYLSDIETGRTEPSLKSIRKIAAGLEMDWRNIFLLTKYVNNNRNLEDRREGK